MNSQQVTALRDERRPMIQWQQLFTIQTNARVKSELKDDEETSMKIQIKNPTNTSQAQNISTTQAGI